MAQIGSFALILALALSIYSFLAGLIALVFQNRDSGKGAVRRRGGAVEVTSLSATLRQGSERLGETARRAGVATFAAVLLASTVLVICAFRDDFSIAYILHHSNR